MLKERFAEHKGYVNNCNRTKTTGDHFNGKGHSVSDMYIQKFNTRYKGLNRINGG